MQDLFTNRSSKKDFVQNAISLNAQEDMEIFIATAFFTESAAIQMLEDKNCSIKIIVRLGFPTSPTALERLLQSSNVEARFFTGNSFHPKIYIFGDKYVLVGSANLTRSALTANQEVAVGLESNDPRFEEITDLFFEYWEESKVLDYDAVLLYKRIYNKHRNVSKLINDIDTSIKKEIGDFTFSNIDRGKKKRTKQDLFLDTYKKSFQESVTAFNKIQEHYKQYGRKVDEDAIPLRLEIDSFFSFVRDKHATHETWKEPSYGWDEIQKKKLNVLVEEWMITDWKHFEDKIVNHNYPLIKKVFKNSDTIRGATNGDLIEALVVLHSFHDRLRFYKGGLDTLKSKFLAENNIEQVKDSFIHLLHGKGNIVKRMSDLLHDPKYKINLFGQANIQELVGWLNRDELPVINGRTTKILRYFGLSNYNSDSRINIRSKFFI